MTASQSAWVSSGPRTRSVSKWLGVAGFACVLGMVAVVLTTPPSSGYERSIYGAYPWFFWFFVVLALFLGQIIVLRAALERYPETAPWRLGFLLVAIVETLLVFMPYIRGYPVYGAADVLTHIGYVRTIEATGGGMFVNIYQNIHQIVLTLSYATGVDPMHVINAVSGVVSLFVLVSLFALLLAVFDRRRALMSLPFVMVLVGGKGHMNPSPFAQSVLFVPFVLYLFVRTQQTESFAFRLPLALAVVGLITYHPLTGLFLILVFVIHYVVVFLTEVTNSGPTVQVSPISSKLVMQLSLVTFLSWYSNYVGMFIRVQFVFDQIFGTSTGESELAHYTSTASQYSPSLFDIAEYGAAMHGQKGVYLAIGSAFVTTTVWLYLRRGRIGTPHLLTWAVGFGLFSALGLVFLTTNLIGGFGRPLMFAQLFAAFAAGSLFYQAYVDFGWQTGVTTVVSVTLAALVIFSVIGLYASPMTSTSNHQVTKQDFAGAGWYLENADKDAPIRQIGGEMYRFEDALNGTRSDTLPDEQTGVMAHFNYTNHETFGASFNETQYLIITERGRVFYPTTYPDYQQYWGFTPADWARFKHDPTVSHVYGNGEFDIYVVQPPDEQS